LRKIKILYVTHHWKNNSHHSKFGGYQRLVDYLPKKIIEPTVLTWGNENKIMYNENIRVIIKKIPKHFKFLFKRLFLIYHSSKISKNYDLVHALYDDVAPYKSSKPLITTFHTTKELDKDSFWLKLRFIYQYHTIKKSSAVIVLSNNMKNILSKHVNNKKIFVIPHGIDTNYFKPIKGVDKDLTNLKKSYGKIILCIGNYGTDFDKLINFAKEEKNILFIILNNNLNLPNLKNLIHFKKVSEKKLLELYTISDFLYRPLKFSSANNSILEAISMGVYVITNDTEGIKDYLTPKNSLITDNIEDIKKFLNKKISKNNIRDINYDWKIISEKILTIYKKALKNE
jgi:glycosyltransferase involved in cell wall biosynthesis